MKAAYIEAFGASENIKIGNLPYPKTKANEVLVKTIAVTVNNVDTFIREGKYPIQAELPFVIGRDFVGEVVENQTENPSFKKGDIVWSNSMGYEDRQGSTSEYVCVAEDRLYSLPEGVDPYLAVSALHATTTAVLLLTDLVQTTPGESILVHGGGGNVGRKLIETARLLHLKVTATSSPKDFSKLRDLGASTLNYNTMNDSEKYSYVVDTSGKHSIAESVSLLERKGRLLIITIPTSADFDAWEFYTSEKQILGFVLSKVTKEQLNKAALFINEQFKNDHYLNDAIEKVPFSEVKQIHREFEQGITRDLKPILVFDE